MTPNQIYTFSIFQWDATNEHIATALLGMLGALTALALEASSDFNYMYDP